MIVTATFVIFFVSLVQPVKCVHELPSPIFEGIMSNLPLPNGVNRCVTLSIVNSSLDWLSETRHPKQALTVTAKHVSRNEKYLSDFVHKSASCFIAIFEESDTLPQIAQTLRKVPWHVIVQIGGIGPSQSELQKLNFPLIWLKHTNNNTYHVYHHCPKARKTGLERLQLVQFWKMGQVNGGTDLKCPNCMKGQTLTFGYVPTGISFKVNGKLVPGGGYFARMFEYLSQVFDFVPKFEMGPTIFHPKNGTWSGTPKQVIAGEVFMSSGRSILRFHNYFDTMFPHHQVNFHIISRLPRIVESSYSVLLPFSPLTWAIILITLLVISTTFLGIHNSYSKNRVFMSHELHRNEQSKVNFYIFTICKITEPDALPWFTGNYSVGRIITAMWALYSLLLILFYNCNLRAYLSAIKYEKRLDSIDDVLENGQRPWIMIEMAESRKLYWEIKGMKGSPWHKLTDMAESMGGIFSFAKHKGPPQEALRDMIDNKAVIVMGKSGFAQMRFLQQHQKVLKGDVLYSSKEEILTYNFCVYVKKNNPARGQINKAVLKAFELGLTKKWPQEGLPMESILEFRQLKSQEKKPMEFAQIRLILYFLASGCGIGLMVFGWELLGGSVHRHGKFPCLLNFSLCFSINCR